MIIGRENHDPESGKVSDFRGRLFDDETEAKAHEAHINAVASLTEVLRESIKTGRVDCVIQQIVVEATAVRAALAQYAKRLPRPNKVQEAKAA